jgi:oligoribonuclease NrnB/cAMP/cGMP phosphodiesterase (DHH superfamily)
MNNNSKLDLIIYHSPCFDGSAGAWCALRCMMEHGHDAPELFGTKPGQQHYNFPDMTGKNVAIIDISFDRDTMLSLVEKCANVVVLDHHKTAERELSDIPNCHFDMNRSGAQMAWDFFFPGETRPMFIEYIADRDLWTWNNPLSRPFTTAIFNKLQFANPQEQFEFYDAAYSFTQEDYQDILSYGACCMEVETSRITCAVKFSIKCEFTTPSGKIYTVYTSDNRLYRSDVGDKLARKDDCDFAVIYSYNIVKNEWWISMRAVADKGFDLSLISNEFPRGGGHACAAGFSYPGNITEILKPI